LLNAFFHTDQGHAVNESLFPLTPKFNRSIRIESRADRLSSDAGALLLREADEMVGVSRWLSAHLQDPRDSSMVVHTQQELLRQMQYLQGQGWVDQDDATTLRDDPVFRVAVSSRRGTSPLESQPGHPDGLASQPTRSRGLETLSTVRNRCVLRQGLRKMAARNLRASGRLDDEHWLDVDGVGMVVHGHQPGAEYNGYFHATSMHPLMALLGEAGDLVGAWLRPGRASAAGGADEAIKETVRGLRRQGVRLAGVRMDAGIPSGPLLAVLEREKVPFVARVRKNTVLKRLAGEHNLMPWLNTPSGAEVPEERFIEFEYKASSWERPYRVICVVVQEPGELFARSFFLVTSYSADEMDAQTVLDCYRQRGTAEGRFGEWKTTIHPMLSSTNRPKKHYRGEAPKKQTPGRDAFACNEALLLLSALAYNLVHVIRCCVERVTQRGWSLQRVRERLLKVAARLVRGGRRLTFVLPRSAAKLQAAVWGELHAIETFP
jgi:hypothetical protein